jgi:hypothetical protein
MLNLPSTVFQEPGTYELIAFADGQELERSRFRVGTAPGPGR